MGWLLTDENILSFGSFAAELKKWNRGMNLTAISSNNETAIKHFIDCLYLAPYVSNEDYLLDIGSGAGFPAIPVKIVKPEAQIVTVDSVAKKINFQRHMIRLLNLQGITAIKSRVEDLQEAYANKFSVITSRAFTKLDHFVTLAAPLLATGGRLIAMKGADAEFEIAASGDKFSKAGFAVTELHHYVLPCNMGKHSLVVLKGL